MFVVRYHLLVRAPVQRCFGLSTSVEVVRHELHMTPVEGRSSGLVQDGDVIRWQGLQLGFSNYHVSEICDFDPPFFFRDRMIEGRFRSFEHDHSLTPMPEGTLLRDEIRFALRWGPVGWGLGKFVLRPHVAKLLRRRFRLIRRLAEGDEWRRYVAE